MNNQKLQIICALLQDSDNTPTLDAFSILKKVNGVEPTQEELEALDNLQMLELSKRFISVWLNELAEAIIEHAKRDTQ